MDITLLLENGPFTAHSETSSYSEVLLCSGARADLRLRPNINGDVNIDQISTTIMRRSGGDMTASENDKYINVKVCTQFEKYIFLKIINKL